jgi:hypothetical protein
MRRNATQSGNRRLPVFSTWPLPTTSRTCTDRGRQRRNAAFELSFLRRILFQKIVLPLLLVTSACASLLPSSESAPPECAIGQNLLDEALKLPWHEFDQENRNPASFRYLADKGCFAEAAQLSEYYLRYNDDLRADQRRNTRFHIGQLYGNAGRDEKALEYIRTTFWSSQPADSSLDWNTYVGGVIAFLEKDRTALSGARLALEHAGGMNALNAKFLARMERCFGRSYRFLRESICTDDAEHHTE